MWGTLLIRETANRNSAGLGAGAQARGNVPVEALCVGDYIYMLSVINLLHVHSSAVVCGVPVGKLEAYASRGAASTIGCV